MYKENLGEFKFIIDQLKAEYNFKGLYHFTDFKNLHSIFKTGNLKSRAECQNNELDFLDAADEEVISKTKDKVKECVRFYFKEKTPTLYRNEGIKVNNSKPHIPIPVYLLFDYELIVLENTVFSSCNAASSYVEFGKSTDFLRNMDWDKIFHRDPLPLESSPLKSEIISKRQAELLSLTDISLDYLNKVIFRSDADYKRAVNIFGEKVNFKVDSSIFNCNNNYIENYKVDITNYNTNKNVDFYFRFHKNNYREYSHRVKIKDMKGNIIRNYKINFTDGSSLRYRYKIKNLPGTELKLEYYMNDILSVEETI
jgi:hypothetical protein